MQGATKLVYPIRYRFTQIHKVEKDYLNRHRVLNPASSRSVIKSYKLLRTQVIRKLARNNWNSLAVVSARSGQGATLTAINLAISVSLEPNRTVLLADFDFRNPSIHRYFNYTPILGLSDYALDNARIEDMLFTPNIESLVVLPGRERFEDSSELLAAPNMVSLVGELKTRYAQRIIIYDMPPLLESDDALAFADNYDAILLVIEEGVTKRSDIKRIAELVGEKPVLGTVFNNVS
ncbi:MAG: exopolysaccharide biosynthesis protein [Pseudomonadales bacterium]|nr:exopolysaccharide biosynthesis protein [Pseudomonadales bacterium]